VSVINNANPGSHISSLIFVDRLLNRHITKTSDFISIESIINQNSPENLFKDAAKDAEGNFKVQINPKKKLPETIDFWTKQGLWDSSSEGIKAFSVLSNNSNIASRIIKTIFKRQYDLQKGASIEPLIRGICLFLALDKCTFAGNEFFLSTEIPVLSAKYIPSRSTDNTRLTINDSDQLAFAEYGLLLGYMERVNKTKFVVDPTRLIKVFLADIFTDLNEEIINIQTFIDQLNSYIPIFDGGDYRVEIENLMQSKKSDWTPSPPHTLSTSLSHALYRLNLEGFIYLDRLSDSVDAVTLPMPNGETRTVSHIRIVGDK